MFPIYPIDTYSEFTYDNLSEIRPGRIRTGLATLAVVAAVAVAALASGEPPVQADVPGQAAIHASINDGGVHGDVVHAEP